MIKIETLPLTLQNIISGIFALALMGFSMWLSYSIYRKNKVMEQCLLDIREILKEDKTMGRHKQGCQCERCKKKSKAVQEVKSIDEIKQEAIV